MGLLIAPLRLPLCTTNTTKKEYDRHFGVYILNNHTKLILHYTYNRWPYDCFVSIKRKQRGDGQDNGFDPLCCTVCVAMAGALCFVFVLFFLLFFNPKHWTIRTFARLCFAADGFVIDTDTEHYDCGFFVRFQVYLKKN